MIHRFLSSLIKALDPSFDGLLFIEDLFQVFPQICTITGLYERLLSALCELQKQLPSAHVVYILSSCNLSEEDRCIMRRTCLPDLFEEFRVKYPLNISYPLCKFICDWQVVTDSDFPCFQAQLSSNVRVTLHSMINSLILIPLYSFSVSITLRRSITLPIWGQLKELFARALDVSFLIEFYRIDRE